MIKNKLKIGLLSFAMLALVFVGSSTALAANITWESDTSVTIGANTYTIISGSAATSMTVGSTTLTVTVPSGSNFEFRSADKFVMNNDQSINPGCNSGYSELTVFGANTSGAVIITPDTATTCSYSGSGGGGGSTPPSDTTPPSNTSVSISAGASTTSTLSVSLTLAATDATQMIISNDAGFAGASWETYATTKSWTLTSGDGVKTVYARFKDAAGNMSVATSDTITVSGTGTIAIVSNEPTGGCSGGNLYNTSTGNPCVNNLGNANQNSSIKFAGVAKVAKVINYKTRSTAVTNLQKFLKAMGTDIYPAGLVTGYYGPLTKAAVAKFQMNYGIVTGVSTPGYGRVGPKTMAKINELLGQ